MGELTARNDQQDSGLRSGIASFPARYAFALVAVAVGMLVTLALFESQVSDQPIYAPLIGAVAFAAWYGGLGPAALVIVVGWTLSLWFLVTPRGELSLAETEDTTRWWINLAVAVVIAVLGGVLRLRRERAAEELVMAKATVEEVEALQQLSVALSAALSSTDVASVVTSHAGAIADAQGVALGLVDGDQLRLVSSVGLATHLGPPGRSVRLDGRTLLTEVARTGRALRAETRAQLDSRIRSSAPIADEVRSALVLPVRVSDTSTGAVAFLFDREEGAAGTAAGLANVVADLAGQALERAGLYERERESRQALDRILQVAPRFLADDVDTVLDAICREARTTFGADYGVLWRVSGDVIELLRVDPPRADVPAGVSLSLSNFPQLSAALQGLGSSFVPDVLRTTSGAGLAFVRTLGIRSSLRTPVVIGGESQLVLSVSWQVVVSEPDAATLAVVRRFADQAGLALEQVERRRAEADALARADATRRLQRVTAALSTAATPLDVSSTCLDHALESTGADAGFVVLTSPDGTTTVELVTSSGFDDDELAAWSSVGLDAEVPFARAISSGESVWALDDEQLSAFTGIREPRSVGWIAVPLTTSRGVRGALQLSLRTPRRFTEADRDWLHAMVSQCGQALERSSLFDREQRSRQRAEQLQSITAQLSNALTPTDVAQVVVEELEGTFGAAAIALATVADGEVAGVLTSAGEGDTRLSALLDLTPGTPGGVAARTLRSVVVDDQTALRNAYPAVAAAAAMTGHETFLALPLVAARRLAALLVASWEHQHALVAEDRAVVEAVAGQAAQALGRAGRYESEQAIAETLQRSVLPDSLPRVEGIELAARYLPGSKQLDVGGDWFDALPLPDGKLGLVVGDVVGKGVQAAASMSQLRNAIRAFSVERLKPSSALARLNRLSVDVLDTSFATVVYVTIDPGSGMCRIATAGHPPPLLAYADGRVELLEGTRGLPLGTEMDAKYRQDTVELHAGTVLLLYTDGLVERRGRSIDDGLADLRAAVANAPTDPDRLLEHILDAVIGTREREDDIAMLAARVLPVAPRALDLSIPADVDSMSLVRDSMRAWLVGTSLDRPAAEGLVLATWEAVANAVEHALEPRGYLVRVHAELVDSRIRVVVEDTGDWAPPSGALDRGFGIRLMEALVTSVDIARGANGTTITLEKSLDGGPAVVG